MWVHAEDANGAPTDADSTSTDSRWPLESRWGFAAIHVPSGESIGMIKVPNRFFDSNEERLGEIILLSSHAELEYDGICHRKMEPHDLDYGNIIHEVGCNHIRSHNIMLIEWEGNFARRQALGRVRKDQWLKVETRKKRIVLG